METCGVSCKKFTENENSSVRKTKQLKLMQNYRTAFKAARICL